VLDRQGWCDAVREGIDPDSAFHAWFAEEVAVRRRLRAFTDITDDR
jgi:hypothetical protein